MAVFEEGGGVGRGVGDHGGLAQLEDVDQSEVEDVAHHEVLDVDAVGGGAGGEDPDHGDLDHDDAVVAGRREESRDGVGDADGNQG